jgi:hypothetical protein
MAERGGLRTAIGGLANMPVASAGGVDLHLKAGRFRLGPERCFGQRGAADIAETDEQDGRVD